MHMYMCVYTHTHTPIHTYICTYMRACVYIQEKQNVFYSTNTNLFILLKVQKKWRLK